MEIQQPIAHEGEAVKPVPVSLANQRILGNQINLDDTVPGEGPANNFEQQSMMAL